MNIIIKRNDLKNQYNVKLNTNKKNVIILGNGDSISYRTEIIRPNGPNNMQHLFPDSELTTAYKQFYNLTDNTVDIYVANCTTYKDYLEVAKIALMYDFELFMPIGLNFSDTFYDASKMKQCYYVNFFLEILSTKTNNITTVLMTGKHASLCDTIDEFIYYMEQSTNKYYSDCIHNKDTSKLVNKYADNVVFVANILTDVQYANVILGALLIANIPNQYLKPIEYIPVFDIDKTDTLKGNYVYFKYNYITDSTDVENTLNMRYEDDIYKNVLINHLIKYIRKQINLDHYIGKLYNAYTILQIQSTIQDVMNRMSDEFFQDYKIINIRFIKMSQSSGYIYIELTIVPYGFLDTIEVLLEV